MELRDKIEALLFASGRKMELEEIGKLVKVRDTNILREKLLELKKHYDDKNSSIIVMEEGNAWKLTTHEQYIELVRQINPHTELSKTIVETLAVIAWKQPMLQSDVIRIRTNKAYDHISQLMEMGFVVKEKYGRTYLLKLTQKFFEYFDLRNDESLKSLFKDIKEAVVDQKKVGDFNNIVNNNLENNSIENNNIKEP
ncbi:SMC-Scp complex subunit ScpB, partial [Candidatus Woesearchaeota archaeon]|nr:SMC-Scp complex subunit ScpB [Candidatus Woesearchaeota archaeon]